MKMKILLDGDDCVIAEHDVRGKADKRYVLRELAPVDGAGKRYFELAYSGPGDAQYHLFVAPHGVMTSFAETVHSEGDVIVLRGFSTLTGEKITLVLHRDDDIVFKDEDGDMRYVSAEGHCMVKDVMCVHAKHRGVSMREAARDFGYVLEKLLNKAYFF